MTDDGTRARPISRRLRFEILRRDGHTCRYCGAKAPEATLTVDHVIPRTLGGADDPTNLVAACTDCNAGKSSTAPDSTVVADVDSAALLFAKALEVATARRIADRDAVTAVVREFNNEWLEYNDPPRPNNWAGSIERFIACGLTLDDLMHFIIAAVTSKASWGQIWRYFCGCCWNEISDRQELARRLIEDGAV